MEVLKIRDPVNHRESQFPEQKMVTKDIWIFVKIMV